MALPQRGAGARQPEITADDDTAALEAISQPLAARLAEAAQQGPLIRQVFISHTGPQQHAAASTFAAAILKPALEAAGLNVMDFSSRKPGANWPEELVCAAANSAVVVVVLTKEYTQHYWCMLELSLAMHSRSLAAKQQQQQEGQQLQQPLIIPLFYDNSDQVVRFNDIFNHWQGPGLQRDPDRQIWVDPSGWAANISAIQKKPQAVRRTTLDSLKDQDYQLARHVVVAAVRAMPVQVHLDPVYGFEQLEAELTAELVVPDPDRLGLWLHGMGGSGKTTLATLLFNRLTLSFQHSAFIQLQHDERVGSQQLVSFIRQLGATGVNEGSPAGVLLEILQGYVGDKAVLILVDNVWVKGQLDDLLPRRFGQGSRVIITSRSSGLPDSQWWRQVNHRLVQHPMVGLTDKAAMQVLCQSANMDPGRQLERGEMRDAVKELIDACRGLPLALQLTGASLHSNDNQPQPVAKWKEALADLRHGRSAVDSEGRLEGILYTTFITLERAQQHMFLDVATALRGQPKEFALAVWVAWHGPAAGFLFRGLERRNLVSCDSEGQLQMHDLLAALGRGMLLWEAPVLAQVLRGTRLWVQDGQLKGHFQAASVLSAQLGHGDPHLHRSVEVEADFGGLQLSDLSRAKILLLGGAGLLRGANNTLQLDDLLWLQSTAPVVLERLPLTNLSALRILQLEDCSQLVELPPTFCQLTALQGLQLLQCSQLARLPSNFGNLTSLTKLEITHGKQLKSLPDTIGQLKALTSLDLGYCSKLAALPRSIGQLTALQQLDLRGCEQLASLANSGLLPLPSWVQHLSQTFGQEWLTQLNAVRATRQGLHAEKNTDQEFYYRCGDGGHHDAAALTDSLNMLPAAKGAASFLLHPDTAATTLALYGRWGTGKSTFMRLVEQQMILEEALTQIDSMESNKGGKLHNKYDELEKTMRGDSSSPKDQAKAIEKLQVLASPRLMTVSFNAWQYLTEGEVWGGLIVEVTQRLEEKLALGQRSQMAMWWQGALLWWQLMLWCANARVALRYNWRKRRSDMLLRFILPIIAVLGVVVLAGWGSSQLWEKAKQGGTAAKGYTVAAVLTAVVGAITAVFTVVDRTLTVVKKVSDVLLEGKSFFQLKDHTDKIGYQHAVIQDLKELKLLLEEEMEWLAYHKVEKMPWCGCFRWPFTRQHAQESQEEQGKKQKPKFGCFNWPFTRRPAHTIRVVVFIDDLDRCKPSKVVEVLEAAHMVLANSSFSVVIGMDKGFVCNAISQAYKESLISIESAEEFLQKIVQVELTLPPLSRTDLRQYTVLMLNRLGEGMEATDKGDILDQPRKLQPQPQALAAEAAAAAPTAAPAAAPAAAAAAAAPAPTADPTPAAAPTAVATGVAAPSPPQPPQPPQSPPSQQEQPPPQAQRKRLVRKQHVYTPAVKSILQFALKPDHEDWLFGAVTPREIKRLLNQFMLATYITWERLSCVNDQKERNGEKQQKFDNDQQRQLLAWCLLWWRYPRGMRLAVQCSSQKASSSLRELAEHALKLYQSKVIAAQATASTMVEKPQSNTKDNKDDVKLRRLEAGVKDLTSILGLLQNTYWHLPSEDDCKWSPGQSLWSISSDCLQQYRLFGMEVLSSDNGGQDVESTTEIAVGAGAAPSTTPASSGDSPAGMGTNAATAEVHDTTADSPEQHSVRAETTTTTAAGLGIASIVETMSAWVSSLVPGRGSTPGTAGTAADDMERGASP